MVRRLLLRLSFPSTAPRSMGPCVRRDDNPFPTTATAGRKFPPLASVCVLIRLGLRRRDGYCESVRHLRGGILLMTKSKKFGAAFAALAMLACAGYGAEAATCGSGPGGFE